MSEKTTPDPTQDQQYMARALELAARGLYTTMPNPRVGCVIVRDGDVVGEGWHERAGEPHAEVFALRAAGECARGATAYVTLEPCAHEGRTPPCTDALIAAGIGRVVVASGDPNPKAEGGASKLRAAGIRVDTRVMTDAARELNVGFFSRFEHGRPWVRVKLAMSLDGRTALASGESKWITGQTARDDVQHWRARSSAILTGIVTVLADNPRMTVRFNQRFTPPMRVVLDSRVRTPASAHIMDGSAPTLVLHDARAAAPAPHRAGVEYLPVPARDGRLDFQAVLALLASRGCNEVQVEAGPTLCGALVAAGLVDELLLYVAPVLLGDQARPLFALPLLARMRDRWQWHLVETRQLGADVRMQLRRE